MIENPKVGQRVVRVFGDGTSEWTTIHRLYTDKHGTRRVVHCWESGGLTDEILDCRLYDSPASAAAALRAEAQRLQDAADKLEQENDDAEP